MKFYHRTAVALCVVSVLFLVLGMIQVARFVWAQMPWRRHTI